MTLCMKKETLFLKIAIIVMGIPVLAGCVIGLPLLAMDAADGSQEMAYLLYGMMSVLGFSAIPYFLTLFQGYRLLTFIDVNQAFSERSVESLKMIKICSAVISGIYVLGLPLFYIVAELDDAPGVILVGMIFVGAPLIIAVFAAVLQKLLKSAIDMKREQELTI